MRILIQKRKPNHQISRELLRRFATTFDFVAMTNLLELVLLILNVFAITNSGSATPHTFHQV